MVGALGWSQVQCPGTVVVVSLSKKLYSDCSSPLSYINGALLATGNISPSCTGMTSVEEQY